MDLNKKVTVLLPNGRRQNIKITPSTTLLQILEEACEKHKFASDEYGLKSHNKELDLSQMFRFTGLPNNCLLEMFECTKKRLESTADICVQLEDGSRRTGQFAPSSRLWDVLIGVCPEYTESDKSPVFVYMRKEIYGKQLEGTSLKSLGITGGRTMLRLLNKKPEEMNTQAGVYIAPVVKEEEKTSAQDISKPSQKQPKKEFAITSALVQSLKDKESLKSLEKTPDEPLKIVEDQPEDPKPVVVYDWGPGAGRTIKSTTSVDTEDDSVPETMEIEPTVNVIGARDAVLYSMDSAQKQIEDLPDSFYDLTVNDLKLVLRDLKKVAEGNEDTPLLTAKLRELEESKTILRKINMYKNCVIRVQFPNRKVLQGIFKPTEKIEDVINFVKDFITNPDLNFYLFTIPPKTLMPTDKTLLELNCVPAALFHFGVDEKDAPSPTANYVKEQFLNNLTPPEGASFLAYKSRLMSSRIGENATNSDLEEEHQMEVSRDSCAPGPSTGAIPKRSRNDHPRVTMDDQKPAGAPKWFRAP